MEPAASPAGNNESAGPAPVSQQQQQQPQQQNQQQQHPQQSSSTTGHVSFTQPLGDKPPRWQMDLMMEKLRLKSSQLKPLMETAKNIRTALMERRCILDQNDKVHFQKCLDSLQQSIKVNSLQSMVERLEMVSRQLGLKFTPGATGNEWFISSDMFYLELLIDPSGVVQEVKIQHDGKSEQQSCPEMVECLKQNDFSDFTAHLKGLVSIYLLNADKKIKSKAFIALQALETDLATMASTYMNWNDGELIVMKSLLGLLQPRKGGHPVKLIYYISPYEFLDVANKCTYPTDVQTIMDRKLGTVATVSIQASSSHKLQMNTTVTNMRTPEGKSLPRYGTLNATNSTALPACFTVNLGKAIPMCKELLKAIQNTTGIPCFDFTNPQPILSLVTHYVSNGTLDCSNNQGLFVALPDQMHCYFMTETQQLEGIYVSSISFTLASQLPQVISILRQQLTFNTLVGSCVRVGNQPESDPIVFEVNALTHQNLAVSFQHPLDDSLVTLEFDLRDVSHPQCRLHAIANAADIIPTLEEHACKVVQRSMSIPITLRAVIRRWQSMKLKSEPPNPDYSVPVNSFKEIQSNEISCGAESERVQQQQHPTINNPVAGMVMMNNPRITPPPPAYTISPVNNFQPSMDMINFMNPLFQNFSNLGGLTLQNLQNLQNLSGISPNMMMNMNMLMQNQNPKPSMLLGLLDQVGQRGRRKKRKATADMPPNTMPSTPSPIGNPNMSRPSPSPSPKSPRMMKMSPKRRPSESSDISESSDRAQTPSSSAIGMLLNELGMENPDPRWNIDITPVTSSKEYLASKLLANAAANSMNEDDDHGKKMKHNFPKRSISLDQMDDHNLQSLINNVENSGDNFKPLVTPSLSITPVSNSTSNTVNSLLAAIRPGIEIIPLPNPVSIPNTITVTPILPKIGENKKVVKKPFDEKRMDKKKKDYYLEKKKSPTTLTTSTTTTTTSTTSSMKKPNSPKKENNNFPNLPSSSPLTSTTSTSPKVASQGKPSVSTLKSVSSAGSPKFNPESTLKKLKERKFMGSAKIAKNLSSIPSGALIPNAAMLPALKALNDCQLSLMPSLMKSEYSNFKAADIMKNVMDKCVTNSNSNSNSSSSSSNSSSSAAAVAAAAAAQRKKGTGLLAVIDKLKSQHVETEIGKKELSKLDYLKASSAITTDVLQQKKISAGSVGGGGSGNGAGGSGGGNGGNGGVGSGGTGGGGGGNGPATNPEYMVKPGGQGLKLTINKTKMSRDMTKEKKGLIKGLVKKSMTSPLGSSGLKMPNKINPVKKNMKDIKDMKDINKKQLPRKESDEMDLTKKLFMPGAVRSLESGVFDGPKFDSNFQIPKKSRSNLTMDGGIITSSNSSSNNSSSVSNVMPLTSMSLASSSNLTSMGASGSITTSASIKTDGNVKDNKNSPEKMDSDLPDLEMMVEMSQDKFGSGKEGKEPPLLEEMVKFNSEPDSTTVETSTKISEPQLSEGQSSSSSTNSLIAPSSRLNNSNNNSFGGNSGNNSSGSSLSGAMESISNSSNNNSSMSNNSVMNSKNLTSSGSGQSSHSSSMSTSSNSSTITGGMPMPPNPLLSAPTLTSFAIPAPSMSVSSSHSGIQNQTQEQEISPESPDPQTTQPDELMMNPATIPTTPQQPPPKESPPVPTSPSPSPDEDQLVMDLPSESVKDDVLGGGAGNSSSSSAPPVENVAMPPPPPPEVINNPLTSSTVCSPPTSPVVTGNTIPIVSVHIVHSPQPNSPATLLRSPLVVQSPHSVSHASSPYAIDDDLMDEALIGTGK